MVSFLDELNEFKEFKENIFPKLQDALKDGMSPEDIAKLGAPAVMAKLVTAALKERDPARAATLAREVLDRAMGKPAQKSEVKVSTQAMSDEDLEAALLDLSGAEADEPPPIQ